MTLKDLVALYDGEVLFSARETITETVTDSKVTSSGTTTTTSKQTTEKTLISFKTGEQDALNSELLERTVDKFGVEVNVVSDVTKKSYNIVVAIYLTEATADDTIGDTTGDTTDGTDTSGDDGGTSTGGDTTTDTTTPSTDTSTDTSTDGNDSDTPSGETV